MARTKKVTITLPVELLESMKTHTDNVSGYLTELAERAERRRLLRAELDRYQGEFGAFTDEEMAEGRSSIDQLGVAGASGRWSRSSANQPSRRGGRIHSGTAVMPSR